MQAIENYSKLSDCDFECLRHDYTIMIVPCSIPSLSVQSTSSPNALPSLNAYPSGNTAETAATAGAAPLTPPRCWEMTPTDRERHKTEVSKHMRLLHWLSYSGIDAVLIGTSLLYRLLWDPDANGPWRAGMGELRHLNASVGGDWVSAILCRLGKKLGFLEALKSSLTEPPKLFILEGGVNDLARNELSVEQIAQGMGQCMDAIHVLFPSAHVSVFGSFPNDVQGDQEQPILFSVAILQRTLQYEECLRAEIAKRQAWSSLCSQVFITGEIGHGGGCMQCSDNRIHTIWQYWSMLLSDTMEI